MMTEIDILDIIKRVVKEGGLMNEVSGVLCDTRPLDSKNEDVCVFVISSLSGQVESAYVVVNVFVGYIHNSKTKQDEWNRHRIRQLAPKFKKVLSSYSSDGFRFDLESQHIEKLEDVKESVITNKLLVKFINE